MKKLMTACTLGALLASSVSADFLRVEAGAGAWAQTPKGYAERTDGDGVLNLNGKYVSDEKESTELYAWILMKHPLPIIPNLRLEYVSISDEGHTHGKVGGLPFDIPADAAAPTTIDIKQYDVIPYYNLLDNTFWMTVDLGLDIKVIESDVNVGATTYTVSNLSTTFPGYSSTDTTVIPLVYLRTRVEIPATNIGFEADAKAITDGTNTMYDIRGKVDYTLDFITVVQPALEVGYRVQKLKIDDGSSAQVDLEYAGVYAGMMVRF
jgi:outer membrane protein